MKFISICVVLLLAGSATIDSFAGTQLDLLLEELYSSVYELQSSRRIQQASIAELQLSVDELRYSVGELQYAQSLD